MRQIILDTETTGLEPKEGHRIIEIGCVEMIDRRLTGNNFHQYINPERVVEEGALKVHGITNEFLADKPLFSEIISDFLDYIGDSEIIAHNAPFDIGFIDHEIKLNSLEFGKMSDRCPIFDTLPFARKKFPGQRNSLDALAKRFNITHFNRELHGALLDSEILAQVYLALTTGQTKLFDDEIQTVSTKKKSNIEKIQTQKSLKIIKATETEINEHEKFLQSLNKSSGGKCVWLS